MSNVIARNFQIGNSSTAGNNFILRTPFTPDGTLYISRGNAGLPTSDVLTISPSNVITFGGQVVNAVGTLGGATTRNRLMNGQFQINQRGTTTGTANGTYIGDRWGLSASGTNMRITAGLSTLPGTSYMITCSVETVKASLAANDYFGFQQGIEGIYWQDLRFGYSNASSVTYSFYYYANHIGIYTAVLRNYGATRAYTTTFLTTPNSWNRVQITVPGETSGTWPISAAGAATFAVFLAAGSNYQGAANTWQTSNLIYTSTSSNFLSNSSNTISFTGFQIEGGTYATAFEQLNYQLDLSNCMRYYETGISYFGGYGVAGSGCYQNIQYRVIKRSSTPSVTYGAVTNSNVNAWDVREPNNGSARHYVVVAATGSWQSDLSWTISADI